MANKCKIEKLMYEKLYEKYFENNYETTYWK